MSGTLPFLNASQQNELSQRIEPACRAALVPLTSVYGAIHADFVQRGLTGSSVMFGEKFGAAIDHFARRGEIAIVEFFRLIEAENKHVSDEEERALVDWITTPTRAELLKIRDNLLEQMHEHGLGSSGVASSMRTGWTKRCEETIRDLEMKISTHRSEWERKRLAKKSERRKEWLDRIPNWAPIMMLIGGLVVGWIAKGCSSDPGSLLGRLFRWVGRD